MKLLLVNTLFPPIVKGGAEVSTHHLGSALASRGHEVHVMTIHPARSGTDMRGGMVVHQFTPKIVPFPYDTERRGLAGKVILHILDNFNPAFYRAASDLIHDLNPDIVHTNILQLISAGIWPAAKSAGAKVVHNLRDYWLLCARSGFFRGGEPCSRKCADCSIFTIPRKHLTKHVDGVVAVSDYVLQTHLAAGLFPNAVAAQAILSATEPYNRGSRRLRDKHLTIGYIGRIKEAKGVHVLLEAMKLVPKDVPLRLIVAGEGEHNFMSSLRCIADERTQFVGWCAPERFYESVDLVVVPSLYPEPLPRTVLEAYRFELPVIAAGSGGIPEVVHSEYAGWLYSPHSRDELAALLISAGTSELHGTLGRVARAEIVAKTEPDYVVSAYEEIYDKVLAK